MNTFLRFFYEFIAIFVEGLFEIFKGLLNGIVKLVNFPHYLQIIDSYKAEFSGPGWLFVGIAVGVLVLIYGLILLLLYFVIRRLFRSRSTKYNQEDLLNEIAELNQKVNKLMREKEELMAMKVSQLGLKPGEEETEGSGDPEIDNNPEIRFPKLTLIDQNFKGIRPKNYNNNFTLEELVDNFQAFANSQLGLYYDKSLLRAFVGGLGAGKLIILQGISGTGKTSLAYAWGKFVNNDSCVASVQPSWRDKTELLGYFNEFTKKFNESPVLAELYAASYDDNVHTIILDEMNIARVEYYFAEMLSILEMPVRSEWIIEIVSSGWSQDPIKLDNGMLTLPPNMWYIGTINNDDSTFMVTDKVYDRAMPIDINVKVEPFESRVQEAMSINASYLDNLFVEAEKAHPISEEGLNKVKAMDDYIIKNFRIAFGNRIMKQLNSFTAVYVSSGGLEYEAIDYFIARKILRKFDQLNIALIKDEIDPFISYLNKEFGRGTMKECISYLELLKKSV